MESKTEEIHELLQSTREEDEDLEGAVLVRWVVVMDWAKLDGSNRYLTRKSSDGITAWERDGMLNYKFR